MGLFSFLFSKFKKLSDGSNPPRTTPLAADPSETVSDATMMVPRIPRDEPESDPADPSDELMDAIATAVMEKSAASMKLPADLPAHPQGWIEESAAANNSMTSVEQPTELISPEELAEIIEPEIVPEHEPEAEETVEPEVVPEHEPESEETVEPEIVPEHEPEVEETVEPEIVPEHEPEVEETIESEIVPEHEPESEETVEPEVVPEHEPEAEETVEPEIVPEHEPEAEETVEPEVVPEHEPEAEETVEPKIVPEPTAPAVPNSTEPIPETPAEQWGAALPENFVLHSFRKSMLPQFDDEKLRLVWKLKGTGKKRRQRVISECVKDQPVFVICDSNGSNCTVITEEGEEIGRLNERDSTVYHEVVAGNPHNLYIKKIRMNDYNKPTVKILVIVRERRTVK